MNMYVCKYVVYFSATTTQTKAQKHIKGQQKGSSEKQYTLGHINNTFYKQANVIIVIFLTMWRKSEKRLKIMTNGLLDGKEMLLLYLCTNTQVY